MSKQTYPFATMLLEVGGGGGGGEGGRGTDPSIYHSFIEEAQGLSGI